MVNTEDCRNVHVIGVVCSALLISPYLLFDTVLTYKIMFSLHTLASRSIARPIVYFSTSAVARRKYFHSQIVLACAYALTFYLLYLCREQHGWQSVPIHPD
jgi:hypothetical protein